MRILLLVTGLLCSLVTSAQIATKNQFGLIKIGNNLSIDSLGRLNALGTVTGATSATTIQALRNSWPVIVVANPTVANVRDAINNAPLTGAHIKLAGGTFTVADLLTIESRPNLWLDFQGFCTWYRLDNTAMIEIKGICPNLRISYGTFINLSTIAGASVVTSYESAQLNNYEFDHNFITVPYADVNAFGIIQYSKDNPSGSQRSNNIDIHHNRFVRVGRMAAEILAQVQNATATTQPYITNLKVRNNYAEDLGRVNTDSHGMAFSNDGAIDTLNVDSNYVTEARNKSIEIVNTRNAHVFYNIIRNVKNQNVTGIAQSAGNAPQSINLDVQYNDVETTAAPYLFFDMLNLKFYRNRGINKQSVDPTHNNGLNLTRVTNAQIQANEIRGAGYHASMLENSTGVTITGNILTTEYSASQYQVVYLYSSQTTNNVILANKLGKFAGAWNSTYINEENGASGNTYANGNDIITPDLPRQPSLNSTGVVLKLDGQGANNSTDIVDSSPVPKLLSKFGNPVISTAQAKYGTSSLYFDGASYLTLPDNQDWNFGTSDYTIETWVYPTVSSSGYPALLSRSATNSSAVGWSFNLSPSNNGVSLNVVNSSGNYTGPGPNATTSIPINAWTHLALVTQSGTRKLYVNGTLSASGSATPSMELDPSVKSISIGAQSTFNQFQGYMHLRITKGAAMYTANFTPPASFLGDTNGEPEVKTFAEAKAAVTPGTRKAFLITNNELYNAPTRSIFDGTNWYHSPAAQTN